MRLHGRLAQKLKDANDAEDLELAVLRRGVPRGVANAAQALEGDTLGRGDVAREQGAARRGPRPAGDGRLSEGWCECDWQNYGRAAAPLLASASPSSRVLREQWIQAWWCAHHGNARVLELSSAVPGEGLSGGNLGEAHRVEDLAAGLDTHTLPACTREPVLLS